MLSGFIFLTASDDFLFFFLTSYKGIFVDGVSFTCHGAFICHHITRLDQIPVSWNFHSFVDDDEVSNHQIVLMKLD